MGRRAPGRSRPMEPAGRECDRTRGCDGGAVVPGFPLVLRRTGMGPMLAARWGEGLNACGERRAMPARAGAPLRNHVPSDGCHRRPREGTVCREGDLNPRPQDLSGPGEPQGPMSPVLYQAEPPRRGLPGPNGDPSKTLCRCRQGGGNRPFTLRGIRSRMAAASRASPPSRQSVPR